MKVNGNFIPDVYQDCPGPTRIYGHFIHAPWEYWEWGYYNHG